MKLNQTAAATPVYTHEGARASLHVSPIDQLRRTVMACLLWENQFYENGESIGERIRNLVAQCNVEDVASLAIRAREEMKLRHAPLLLVRELARRKGAGSIVGRTLTRIIQRADELAEFLAIYWKDDPEQPVSKQVRLGLAAAFRKFDTYQFAKYDRNTTVKLRDVLFLSHAKPKDATHHYTKFERQEERRLNATPKLASSEVLYRQIAERTLPVPDTWEVALSGGAGKRETFERLLTENRLGYLALLRNLRNMAATGVSQDLVHQRLMAGAVSSKALPFRFVAAARAVPQWEPMIDEAMCAALNGLPRLSGTTNLIVDVSGSMSYRLSTKSGLSRMDAAAALAVLVCGIGHPKVRVFTFSTEVVEVAPRRGMALIDAIVQSQLHLGTHLGKAVQLVESRAAGADRTIVITDEQSADPVNVPAGLGYMMNVASFQNGVGYGSWTKIDGFSESVIRFIQELELESQPYAPVSQQ